MAQPPNADKSPQPPSRVTPRSRVTRVLNARLLLETLIVAVILAPAIYFWYTWQVRREATAMLERAEELEKDKDDAAAAQYYFQYLKLRPDDAGVQVLLAEAFDRAAKDPQTKERAIEYYYEALGVAPPDKRPDLHRRLAELLLQRKRYAAAEDEANELLKADKNDAQGQRLLALALFGQSIGGGTPRRGKLTVGDALAQALKSNPRDVEIAVTLAETHRNLPQLLNDDEQTLSKGDRERLADQTIAEMVAADPKSAKAYVARYQYRLRHKLPNAKDDLASALKLAPDDLDVVLLAAAQARRDADSDSPKVAETCRAEACKHYEHAMQVAPSNEVPYLGLGELYVEQGKPESALKTWRSGLEKCNKESFDLNYRLADLLIDQKKFDDAEKCLAAMTRTAERIGPALTQSSRFALKRAGNLLQGKWFTRKGQYAEAIPLLRAATIDRPSTLPEYRQSTQAWQWLGVALAATQQLNESAVAYEHAATLAPKDARLASQAAAAWARAGRPDVAAKFYGQSLVAGSTQENRLAMAVTEFQRQLPIPVEERHWEAFDKALSAAKKTDDKEPLADPWRLSLLDADYLLARGQESGRLPQATRDAIEIVRAAEKAYPDATGLAQALVLTYERLGLPSEADRALNRLEKMKDQAGPACLARAGLLVRRKQYGQAEKVLSDGLKSLPADQQVAVQRDLLQLELRQGQLDRARTRLLKLHEQEPASIEWLVQLAELALASSKTAEIEQWEKELRKIEGSDGLYWQYFRAYRLATEATGPYDAKLAQASELQAKIQTKSPKWSKVYVLGGQLCESRGKHDQAIEAYQEAIRLGERQQIVYERLIGLLTQMDRLAEADRYLQTLKDQIAGSETLTALDIAVAVKRGQTDRALATARRGVERRPGDPLARVLLGQLLVGAGKTVDAEKELKKAVELAPDDTRTLAGLFGFYLRSKQPDRAKQTLQEVGKNEKLSEVQRATILAQGYESLGDQEQANANYRRAAKLAADDAAVQLRLADYLVRTSAGKDRSEPERILRGVRDRWPDSGPARRMLAELLMERGGTEEWQEAIKLMEQAGADRTMPDVDRRMQAILLARRGGKQNLEKATQILEELVVNPKMAVALDRQWLAQLYEAQGNVDLARQQYVKLLSRENTSLSQRLSYVEFLMRHDLQNEADAEHLQKAVEMAPDDLGVATVQARWLHAMKQDAKIEPLVEALAEKLLKKAADKKQQADLMQQVGTVYAAAGRQIAAERWYRKLVELMPERFGPLAGSLAQQGRMREAIELCQKAAQSDPSARPALVLATVLLTGKPKDEDYRLAEATLTKALAEQKDNADLLSAVAGVRVIQKRIDEAVKLYRQVLALNPTRPIQIATLNNLATLLAEQPDKRKEALEFVDRAINIIGPQPGLLDTKGMILVYEKKPGDAVPLLLEAAATPQSDPRFHFHLAVAYDRTGEKEKARASLDIARKGNLAGQVLTELDREMLADLEKKFGG